MDRQERLSVTNDETAFREVDEALAQDQQWEFLRKRGALLIGGAAAIVLGVAGWQAYNAHQRSQNEKAAVAYKDAGETLNKDPEAGKKELAALAETGPDGYAALATMMRAGVLAQSGDRDGALAAYRELYKGAGPKRMKELARLRAATLAMKDGRDAVLADLGDLSESKTKLGYYARELEALAALEAKDYETAQSMFAKAAADENAPEPLRQRAGEFAALALAAKSGANITGDFQSNDLLKALGEEPSQPAPPSDAAAAPLAAPDASSPQDQ
jgi:hypothetical protein